MEMRVAGPKPRPGYSSAIAPLGVTARRTVVLEATVTGRRELVGRRRVVRLARIELRRRELADLIRGVREVLGLERQSVALAVLPATRAVQRAVQEVARIELEPRLVGRDRQQTPAGRVEELSRHVTRMRVV